MGKNVNGLIGRKVAFLDGALQHGADGSQVRRGFPVHAT